MQNCCKKCDELAFTSQEFDMLQIVRCSPVIFIKKFVSLSLRDLNFSSVVSRFVLVQFSLNVHDLFRSQAPKNNFFEL